MAAYSHGSRDDVETLSLASIAARLHSKKKKNYRSFGNLVKIVCLIASFVLYDKKIFKVAFDDDHPVFGPLNVILTYIL